MFADRPPRAPRTQVIRTRAGIFRHYLISSSASMFFVIGLGLSDEKDVTLRGLEVTSTAKYVNGRLII